MEIQIWKNGSRVCGHGIPVVKKCHKCIKEHSEWKARNKKLADGINEIRNDLCHVRSKIDALKIELGEDHYIKCYGAIQMAISGMHNIQIKAEERAK